MCTDRSEALPVLDSCWTSCFQILVKKEFIMKTTILAIRIDTSRGNIQIDRKSIGVQAQDKPNLF